MTLEVIREIDTEAYRWCDSAVLVKVKNCSGVLTNVRSSKAHDNEYYRSSLMLSGKPLIQGEYPISGTCCALLARGYGIENLDSKEFREIREKINSPFTDFYAAIDNIKLILGLLNSGYYVISDARLYPTDGEDHFFANVSDNLSYVEAATEYFCSLSTNNVTSCFPAYLYPTQSNTCLNVNRAREYLDMIDRDNSPRAIAYYHYGFMCALLDGHHKAYAAAMKGTMLRALVIIPISGYQYELNGKRLFRNKACFADIAVPLDDMGKYCDPKKKDLKKEICFEKFRNDPVSEEKLLINRYPDIVELSDFLSSNLESVEITAQLLKEWLLLKDEKDIDCLKYAVKYYSKTDEKLAFMIAEEILKADKIDYVNEIALEFFVTHKSDEAEKLVIKYLIDHDLNDRGCKIASEYWS